MGCRCGVTATVSAVFVMSAPRKRGLRAVVRRGGVMNFQPGPETICWNGLRQSDATLLTKRLLKPAPQKHSAADPGVVPSAVPGPLSRGLMSPRMLATKFSSKRFSVSEPSSIAIPAPVSWDPPKTTFPLTRP